MIHTQFGYKRWSGFPEEVFACIFYMILILYLTAEDYTNMSYYNLCGISYRSQHSNISKGKKGVGDL
jgi:hypothetical protein